MVSERALAYEAVAAAEAGTKPVKSDGGDRGKWGNRMEFILSCVGYAVGLGNVWRFPYLCYKNGGGAFLIPYFIMLMVAGLPLFVLDLGVGQFASRGCISIWTVSPLFRGLGYAMVFITTLVNCYYNVIISYIIYYLFASFSKVLPWATCDNEWNTLNCTVSMKGVTDVNDTIEAYLGNDTESNRTFLPVMYQTRPSAEFWNNQVLQRSGGVDEPGEIRWQLVLCLLASWAVVYLCIMKGVKSSGKVVYFTATFPYVVIFILLLRGVTLPGAANGMLYFIKPNFSRLQDANVWKDAAVQIFYSLGSAFGCLHTMASYNQFHNNFHRDGIIISFINCFTSVFAGFVIFSVIGFMSHSSGLPIDKVADSGPGLAFVAYPEALARMPVAPLWSILFFLMLFTLGLDSMFVQVETVITAICDEIQQTIYPAIYKKKAWVGLGTCFVLALINLSMVTQGGIYVVTLFDNYCAGLSILLIAFLECIVFSYVYGIDKFSQDLQVMLGFKIHMYWKVCWMFVTPMVLVFIFIFFCVGYTPLTYAEYVYPLWANMVGWAMTLIAIAMIPGYGIYFVLVKTSGSLKQRIQEAMTPLPEWGPSHNKDRVTAGYALVEKEEMHDPQPDTPPPEYKSASPSGDEHSADSVEMEPVAGGIAV